MRRNASQANIGKRCYLLSLQLQSCPFFPATLPFRIVGASDSHYLVEGPWTDQVQWSVAARQVRIPPVPEVEIGEQ